MSNKNISTFYDSPIGIMLVDIKGNVIDFNNKILELFDYNITELKEQLNLLTYSSIINSDISDYYKKCFELGIAFDFKSSYVTHSGKEIFLRFVLIPTYDNKTKITGCITIVENILLQKHFKESVELIRDKWENTFNAISDLIIILDVNYKIINVNKALADKLGRTPQECIGLTCYEVIHGDSLPPPTCPHKLLLTDGQTHEIESYETLLGGYYSIIVSPIKDINNQIIGSVHVARDITERKLIRESIEQSESKFKSVFDNSPIPIAITRQSDGLFLDINKSWEKLLGYNRTQIIGKYTADINIFQDIKDRNKIIDILKKDKQINNLKLTLLHKSGRLLYVLFSVSTIKIDDQNYWITSFVNTTDQVLLEHSIKEFRDTVIKNSRDEISKLLKNGTYIR